MLTKVKKCAGQCWEQEKSHVRACSPRDREERTRIAVNWRSSPKNDKDAKHEEDKGYLPQCNVLGTPRRGLRPRSPPRGRSVTPRRDSCRRRRWQLSIPILFRNDIKDAEALNAVVHSHNPKEERSRKHVNGLCKQRERSSSSTSLQNTILTNNAGAGQVQSGLTNQHRTKAHSHNGRQETWTHLTIMGTR